MWDWYEILRNPIYPYSCGIVCLATKMPALNSLSLSCIKKTHALGSEPDEDNKEIQFRIGVFQLEDNRWVCVRASVDQNGNVLGVEAVVSCSRDEIIRFGLTEHERRLLNLTLPEDDWHKI